jgi:hypothetical protein
VEQSSEEANPEALKIEVLEVYATLLKQQNKKVVNELVRNSHALFSFFTEFQEFMSKPLLKIFTDKIKKPLLGCIDKVL